MARAVYYVVLHQNEWKIKHDGKHYGPYGTQGVAIRAAVDAAHESGKMGYDAQVLVQGRDKQVPDRMDLREGSLPASGVMAIGMRLASTAPRRSSARPTTIPRRTRQSRRRGRWPRARGSMGSGADPKALMSPILSRRHASHAGWRAVPPGSNATSAAAASGSGRLADETGLGPCFPTVGQGRRDGDLDPGRLAVLAGRRDAPRAGAELLIGRIGEDEAPVDQADSVIT
jgi:hypothetical protein